MSDFGPFIPEKVHLLRVDIVKGLIDSPTELNPDDILGYEFGMAYSGRFNLKEKLAKTELEINISSRSTEDGPRAKGLFRLAFLFKIENLETLVRQNEGELRVSTVLGNAMAAISYSTARGILLTRFQGTTLKEFILPVIDPNILLKPENSLQSKDVEGES